MWNNKPVSREIMYVYLSSNMITYIFYNDLSVQILCTLLGLVIFYISFGQHREGISDVIGFAYPCYQTLVCLTNSTGQERRLMIYWLVFGFFQLVDYAADQICSIFPFYFLFKTCVYLYLLIPATKGIEKMDKMVLRPFLARSNDLAVWLQKSDWLQINWIDIKRIVIVKLIPITLTKYLTKV